MFKRMLARLAGESGSALFEYAITFPLFMTMLLGICNFGNALYAYHFVDHAAKSATRWAAVNGSTCTSDGSCAAPAQGTDIVTYVKSQVPSGIDSSKITVNPNGLSFWPSTTGTCAATSNAPGCTVQIQVSYDFSFILPLAPVGPLTLSSTSQMVIAH